MAHLTLGSIQQLLTVLDLTRQNHARVGMPNAYHDAVRDVSRHHSVTYQTIGDFRRRLAFSDIHEYMREVGQWLGGDASALRQRLTTHGEDAAEPIITRFFEQPGHFDGANTAFRVAESDNSGSKSISSQGTTRHPLEELRLRVTPELRNRIHLAHLAKVGPTLEETAVLLLERGFELEKQRIKKFLDEL